MQNELDSTIRIRRQGIISPFLLQKKHWFLWLDQTYYHTPKPPSSSASEAGRLSAHALPAQGMGDKQNLHWEMWFSSFLRTYFSFRSIILGRGSYLYFTL